MLLMRLLYLGYGVAEQYLNLTSLTEETDIATDMEAALIHLSQNCTLQQWLSFGQLLLKYEWGTPEVSYCQWYGTGSTCLTCLTSLIQMRVVITKAMKANQRQQKQQEQTL